MDFYAHAYHDLRTEVNAYNGLIPQSSIRQYASRLDLVGDELQRFIVIITKTHDLIERHWEKKRQEAEKYAEGNIDEQLRRFGPTPN